MADISITAANVVKGAKAKVETGIAGATITAGQVVYKDASDANKFKLADANSGTAAARTPYGIALNGAAADQPLSVLTEGEVTIGGTLTQGLVYVLSATAGGIAPAADLASGHYTGVLGVAKTAAILSVKINAPGAVV